MYSSVTDPAVLDTLRVFQEEIDGEIHRRERLAEQDKQISELIKENERKDILISDLNIQLSEVRKQLGQLSGILAEHGLTSE